MEDNFHTRSNAFMECSKSNGCEVSDAIELVDLREHGRGRGVVAKRAIVTDEALFSIPRGLILQPDTSSLPSELLKSLRADLEDDEWSMEVLTLIFEHCQGGSSRWKPYLDMLPLSFETPMFWTAEELAELQASSVRKGVGKESADEAFVSTILPVIRKYMPSLDNTSDAELHELYHRMASTIMAYAFDVPQPTRAADLDDEGFASDAEDEALPKGMVPLADMLNADADRNNARLFHHQDEDGHDSRLVMRSILPIPAGEEIFNDYGPLPRSELLRRYGYVTARYARYDDVTLSEKAVLEAVREHGNADDGAVRARVAFLDDNDVDRSAFTLSWPDGEGAKESEGRELGAWRDDDDDDAWLRAALGPDLSTALAVLVVLGDAEFDRARAKARLPSLERVAPPGSHGFAAACRVLLSAVRTQAAAYETTLQQDRDIPNPNPTPRTAMALAVRVGEKEILAAAAERLLALLTPPPVAHGADEGAAAPSEQHSSGDVGRHGEHQSKRRKLG